MKASSTKHRLMKRPSQPHQESNQLVRQAGDRIVQLRRQRVQFAIFLKVLLQRLEKCDDEILHKVKQIVRVHSRSKRNLSVATSSVATSRCLMIESMEGPIRAEVGELHWIRTHQAMRQIISAQL
jgi:hypothetical protein